MYNIGFGEENLGCNGFKAFHYTVYVDGKTHQESCQS